MAIVSSDVLKCWDLKNTTGRERNNSCSCVLSVSILVLELRRARIFDLTETRE